MSQPDIAGGLRPSDKDREATLAILAAAYGDGRIGKAEHDVRVTAAHEARLQDDLQRLTADLPKAEITKAEIRRTRRARLRESLLDSANRRSGSISWVRWQWAVVGCFATAAAGVFLLIPAGIAISLTRVVPRAVRDGLIGASVVSGLLLVVVAVCMGVWLYDIQEARTVDKRRARQ